MSNTRTKLLKGGSVLIVGELVNRLAGLLRNFIVARIIAPEQYGIAAALAMSISLVEMLSDLGAGRYLTRTHGEDGLSWLAAAHGIVLCRGLINALVLFLIAPWIANLMHMNDVVWAFRAVAIIPFLRSLTHNQIWLAQRDLRYKSFVLCQSTPQLITLALAWPIAHWLGDFRSMLFLLIINTFISSFLSHIVATTPYHILFDKDKIIKLLLFGLPLAGDGVLVFIILEGERIAIANVYDKMVLGAYSAAFLLTWTPAATLTKIGFSLGVPQLASLRNNTPSRDAHYRAGVTLMLAPAVGLVTLFGLAGPAFIATIYGPKYQVSSAMAGWLGLIQAFRIIRVFPTVLAIAEGFTLTAMVANSIRAVSVGIAWYYAKQGHDPWVIPAIGATGELAAVLGAVTMNRVVLAVSTKSIYLPIIIIGAIYALSYHLHNIPLFTSMPTVQQAILGVVSGGVVALCTLGIIPSARRILVNLIKHSPSRSPMTSVTEADV